MSSLHMAAYACYSSTPFVTVHLSWAFLLLTFSFCGQEGNWHLGELLLVEVLERCPWLCKVNNDYLFICLFVCLAM